MIKWMQKFFQYLDRFYVEMHSLASLRDQGFKIFKDILFKPMCTHTTNAIVELIKM